MSFFGLFSGCSSIVCCSNRDQGDSNNQNADQLGGVPDPQRMKQLILDSQRNNTSSFVSDQQEQQSYQEGTYQPKDSHNMFQFPNTQQNEDPTDGFIEITPIFQVPKLGSSGSENQDDYCPELDEGSQGSNMRHQNSQVSYSSGSFSPHNQVKQQEFSELVPLPVNYSATNNMELQYNGEQNGNRQQVELRAENNNYYSNSNTPRQQKSYKETIRSRNSSQHSQERGDSQQKIKRTTKAWTEEEDRLLRFYYSKHNGKWPAIANEMADRNTAQCSQRWRRIKPSKIRRPWTPEEDVFVMQLINQHGKNWGLISSKMDNRSGKQVRERYINKLDPSLNNDQFTEEEDQNIIDKYYKIGPKWSEIAKYLQGRSENMVKNRFYSFIKKAYVINSLQRGQSDTGSQYDAGSSPRVQNQEDKNSSYVSSNYTDLEPSVGSGFIESQESQESLSDNEGLQNGGMNLNNNSYQTSGQRQLSNVTNYSNNNITIENNLNFNNNKNNLIRQGQDQTQQQNQIQQESQLQNANPWGRIENPDEMFRTPRQALANNSSFFPNDIFFQQHNNQDEGINGQQHQQQQQQQPQQLLHQQPFQQQQNEIDPNNDNIFFQANPSLLLLLSPTELAAEKLSFPSNSPNPQVLLSNNNSNNSYQQQQQQRTYTTPSINNNNHIQNTIQQQYVQHTAGSNNTNNLNGSLINNFALKNNLTNLEVINQQQQQLNTLNSFQNQQNQEQINQNGVNYNYSNNNTSEQIEVNQMTTFQEPFENLNNNNDHQNNVSDGQYNPSLNLPSQQGFNGFDQFHYQSNNSQLQNNDFNGVTQQYQQQQSYNQQQQSDFQSNQLQNTNNDSSHGIQFIPFNYENSNNTNDKFNQNGISNGNSNTYMDKNLNLNNKQLGDFQTNLSQQNLRLDVKPVRSQQNSNQAVFMNGQQANPAPKINRRQLNTLIVDLETQLQLLKVKQQKFNDEDSDC